MIYTLQGADVKAECLQVEDKVLLRSTADWVDFPQILLLPHNGRNFEIKVRMYPSSVFLPGRLADLFHI